MSLLHDTTHTHAVCHGVARRRKKQQNISDQSLTKLTLRFAANRVLNRLPTEVRTKKNRERPAMIRKLRTTQSDSVVSEQVVNRVARQHCTHFDSSARCVTQAIATAATIRLKLQALMQNHPFLGNGRRELLFAFRLAARRLSARCVLAAL